MDTHIGSDFLISYTKHSVPTCISYKDTMLPYAMQATYGTCIHALFELE